MYFKYCFTVFLFICIRVEAPPLKPEEEEVLAAGDMDCSEACAFPVADEEVPEKKTFKF